MYLGEPNLTKLHIDLFISLKSVKNVFVTEGNIVILMQNC